jgi:hypothetical protein
MKDLIKYPLPKRIKLPATKVVDALIKKTREQQEAILQTKIPNNWNDLNIPMDI